MEKKDFIIKNEDANLALLRFFWAKLRSCEGMDSRGAALEKLDAFLIKEVGENFGVTELLNCLIEMGFLKQEGSMLIITKKGSLIGWY